MTSLSVDPSGAATGPPCADCGELTRQVWGYVSRGEAAHAVYYIRWTDGHLERGAEMCVSIGGWGGGLLADRSCVGLDCRLLDNRPGIIVVDAATLPWRKHEAMLGTMRSRAEVVGTPLAHAVYEVFEAVLEQDHRLHAFLAGLPYPS